ncbi:MAG: HD domain-containing phosphohydrolase, partial [Bacillota bacterium]|nr:HD domain-containing phosphohydrolase [Bacillota bacterium]
LQPEIRGQIFYAGMLHDVGAMGLPDHVVHYPTKDEQKGIPQIVAHCYLGGRIAGQLPGLQEAKLYIEDHHEWWDGSGYPKGKKQQEICLGGQILRLADSFDLWLRGNKNLNRAEIIERAATNVDSEYSMEIFLAFKKVVNSGAFYHRITRENSLSFYMTQLERRFAGELNNIDFSLEEVLTVFAQVIDAKHQYTKGHSERVAEYSRLLAKAIGFSEEEQQQVKWAGLVHDVGKLAVPRKVLDKAGKLEGEEIKLIRLHPILTLEILQLITGLEELAAGAGYHHERFDGRGYPDGLQEEEIPLIARVVCVADAFDAMTSGRPYQKTKTVAEAIDIIKANSGSQFDPMVIEVIDVLHNTTLP